MIKNVNCKSKIIKVVMILLKILLARIELSTKGNKTNLNQRKALEFSIKMKE